MALKVEGQIADTLEDQVGLCLREFHSIKTWTADKTRLFEMLIRLANQERYFSFKGDFRDYHLERKGQSCLYDVPENQRGALLQFRGRRIRLICEGAWDQYAGRFFLAKPVQQDSTKTLKSEIAKRNT